MSLAGLAVVLVLPALGTAQHEASEQALPRLEGSWAVSIVYKVAENLQGRKAGQKVRETWTFRPRCKKGACPVELRRAGRTLVLRPSKTAYGGTASFEGTFFCNGRTYPAGTVYVETWIVRIRRSGPSPRGRRALRIQGLGATVGRSEEGLPCAPVVSREAVEFGGVPARR